MGRGAAWNRSEVSEQRPRLLLVSPLPPPAGGIATWTAAIRSSAIAREFELRIVNTSPLLRDQVDGRSRIRGDRLVGAARILGSLVLALVRFRPEIVHVNTSYYWGFLRDGLVIWLARLAGARTVLHFRGGDFPEFVQGLPRPVRALVCATLRRVDRLVPITRATESFLETIVARERIHLLPNFIRLEDIDSATAEHANGARAVEVLFVGWIIEGKGVGELLEAAERLPEVHFTLVGVAQPSYLERIRSRVDSLEKNVTLLGPRDRGALLGLYRGADLFVLPTYREGFPNVVLEAMAAGLPVVATPVGAIPDVVRDGQEGLLVPARDADRLTEAIQALAQDPELRRAMGQRGRERCEALYSIERVTEELASVYRKLLLPASAGATR